ncbi:MAG: class I SAM-dependent methyltransferase [Bryobacteraceae bacterium]|jgi:SAM-dependent methyltransferase
MGTEARFAQYYYSRPEFVDGTTEFHRICARFIPVGERVLEIGPGPTNPTSAFLASRGNVVGVDISNEVLGNESLAEARVYDGLQIPFEDASFLACVSDYVLEHVTNPHEHFREVGRILRPGGVYCFRTPNLWHYVTLGSKLLPHRLHTHLANRLRGLGNQFHEPYPTLYAANTRTSIRRLAAASGLQSVLLDTIEKEPSYARTNAALFFPMMAYERLVNSSRLLGGLRVNILGVLQQPTRANCG